MNLEIINLDKGLKILIDVFCPYDIFIGIKNKGFDYDYINNITGLTHLFEHSVFRHRGERDSIYYNGYTTTNHVCFFNIRKDLDISFEECCENLIYKFYDYDYQPFLKTFNFSKLNELNLELENEYYFRKSYNIGFNSLSNLNYGKQYLGGREVDLENIYLIEKKMKQLWKDINPEDVLIILKEKNDHIISLINKTFGKIKKSKVKYSFENIINHIPTKTLNESSYILTKCENENNISIRVDCTKENYIALFLLSTLGVCVNTFNNNLYITFSIEKSADDIIKFLYNTDSKEIINNLLSNNDKRIYIEEIFQFYQFIDISILFDKYLYDDDYYNKYKKYLLPLINNMKENMLVFGNLIVNLPSDKSISINKKDLNGDGYFITEILLDIKNNKKKEKMKLKRKTNKNKYITYKQVYSDYKLNLYNNINNYCYFILLYSNYNICINEIGENISIVGDRYYIKNINKLIKEPLHNLYFKDFNFTPIIYEILFQFYFFDKYCPSILDIIEMLRSKETFSFERIEYDKHLNQNFNKLKNKVYFIETEYNFVITLIDKKYIDFHYFLNNYVKDAGLSYSTNIYESDNYIMLFNLSVDSYNCYKEIQRFLLSYFPLKLLFIVSKEADKINLDNLIW